ncbi:MAG: hypothetical protein ACRENP_09425 [Longimicrobiales bacterium]
MHLDQEQVERLLHGELTSSVQIALRDHMAVCSDCHSRFALAQREHTQIMASLAHLDHTAPRTDARDIVAAANTALTPWPRAAHRSDHWLRWAAGLALAVGIAGAVYAAPGWIARWTSANDPPSLNPAPSVPLDQPANDASGLTVTPGDRLSIEFLAHQLDGTAYVSISDVSEVVVRTLEGSASFESDEHRLKIDNYGRRARFEILIPRNAAWVEVKVAGQRAFLMENARVVGPALRADNRYTISLAHPG